MEILGKIINSFGQSVQCNYGWLNDMKRFKTNCNGYNL